MLFQFNVLADGTENDTPAVHQAIDDFNDTLRAGGHRVFAGGMETPDHAFVVDNRNDSAQKLDGPYVASTLYPAGLWIIEAADRDTALALAIEASKACDRRIEVRAFLG
jgi:hypothetical protein